MKKGSKGGNEERRSAARGSNACEDFEDARFEAALKLGSFDAIRDTRYLSR